MRKKINLKFLIFLFAFTALNISAFADDLVPIPSLNNRVTDLTATLSVDEISQLETTLAQFDTATTNEIAILIVPTTGNETIEQYSMRVAEQWKIGKAEKDNGIILLVAKNDRKVRIEVGYGLEAVIPDATAMQVIDNYIIPNFKNGNFYLGINSAVFQIMGILEGTIDYQAKTDTVNTDTVSDVNNDYRFKAWFAYTVGFLMILSFLIPFLPLFFTRKKLRTFIISLLIPILYVVLMSIFVGGFILLFIMLFYTLIVTFFSILAYLEHKGKIKFFKGGGSSYSSGSSYRSSYRSSSFGGGSSFGGSSSFGGGFSGGGGSFGGGGASGSW